MKRDVDPQGWIPCYGCYAIHRCGGDGGVHTEAWLGYPGANAIAVAVTVSVAVRSLRNTVYMYVEHGELTIRTRDARRRRDGITYVTTTLAVPCIQTPSIGLRSYYLIVLEVQPSVTLWVDGV